MLAPKKMKYRKMHRGRGALKGKATNGTTMSFGEYGLKAITAGEISSRQLEASRRAIANYMKRGGKIWIRIFPHKPVTIKAAETPMGSGKGTVDHYVSPIKAGKLIFEIDGVDHKTAIDALSRAAHKLPMKCKIVQYHQNA